MKYPNLYSMHFTLYTLFLLCTILLLGCSQTAVKTNQQKRENTQQFDSYAEWVEDWLADEYNLPLGTWLFESEERNGLKKLYATNVQTQLVPVSNMPFTMALQLQTDSAQKQPWNGGISTRTSTGLQADDNVLLIFWARALESEADRGALLVTLQKRKSSATTLSELIPINSEWQQITLRGTVPLASAADETTLFFGTGAQTQKLEIGGLSVLNYETSVALTDLPQMELDNYPGQEADASWRVPAAARIDHYRKADLEIIVVDEDNNPIEDATVNVAMQKHAFGFGTAVNTNVATESTRDAEIYREKFLDLDGKGHGFNIAVPENGLKWTRWEADNDSYKENAITTIDWLLENDIKVRGHNLLWPGWSHMPAEVEENEDDPDYLIQRTHKRIEDMLSEPMLNGRLYEWDVVNELRTNTDIANSLYADSSPLVGEAIYPSWYKRAAETDASTKLFINDYGMVSDAALLVGQHNHYKHFIQSLIDNDDNLHGIGLQGHLDYPLAGPERIYALLSDFAKYNKDIVITEYDISLRYRNEADLGETAAGAYTRDFLTTIFSHPDVTGFLMWGYWDEIHWQDDSPMYRADWSIKPAGEAFIDLVFNQWWTDEEGKTNADGHYQTRGFLGEYAVTVTAGDATKTVDTTLTPEMDVMTILLDTVETNHSTHLPFITNKTNR